MGSTVFMSVHVCTYPLHFMYALRIILARRNKRGDPICAFVVSGSRRELDLAARLM